MLRKIKTQNVGGGFYCTKIVYSPSLRKVLLEISSELSKYPFMTQLNQYVVYPSHGVGKITEIVEQEIAGMKLELYVIYFEEDKMTLRVPIGKVTSTGMRSISDTNLIDQAFTILKSNAKTKKTMWSRRAQEYESKINSGDIIALSEVVRDLHRNPSQSEQSYSERQLYESALDRLAKEVSRSRGIKEIEAISNIENQLAKNAKNAAAISAAI